MPPLLGRDGVGAEQRERHGHVGKLSDFSRRPGCRVRYPDVGATMVVATRQRKDPRACHIARLSASQLPRREVARRERRDDAASVRSPAQEARVVERRRPRRSTSTATETSRSIQPFQLSRRNGNGIAWESGVQPIARLCVARCDSPAVDVRLNQRTNDYPRQSTRRPRLPHCRGPRYRRPTARPARCGQHDPASSASGPPRPPARPIMAGRGRRGRCGSVRHSESAAAPARRCGKASPGDRRWEWPGNRIG